MDNTKEPQFELESAFAEVFLTCRITQIEDKMLKEIRGWLQTENQTATIRKQEAVRRTIRMAYEHMQLKISQMDNKIVTFPTQPQPTATEPPQIVDKPKRADFTSQLVEDYRAGKRVGNDLPPYENKSTQNVHSHSTIILSKLNLGVRT
jgi:hypothetical protein